MRKIVRAALIVAVCFAATSSVLLFANGGFGGGHGSYDAAIGILTLPWCLMGGLLPNAVLQHVNDFTLFVLAPFLLNVSCVAVLWFRSKPQ